MDFSATSWRSFAFLSFQQSDSDQSNSVSWWLMTDWVFIGLNMPPANSHTFDCSGLVSENHSRQWRSTFLTYWSFRIWLLFALVPLFFKLKWGHLQHQEGSWLKEILKKLKIYRLMATVLCTWKWDKAKITRFQHREACVCVCVCVSVRVHTQLCLLNPLNTFYPQYCSNI